VIVMAHLKSLETRQNDHERLAAKIWLTKRLYQRGYERQDIINLFRFIDWVIQLPEGLDEIFWREVQAMEEAEQMPYITSVERIGIRKGLEQGIQQGQAELVLGMLNRRFGAVPSELEARLRTVPSDQMPALLDAALTATTLAEVAVAVEALPQGAGYGVPRPA